MEDRCAFLEEEIPRIESAIAHTEQQLGVYVSAEETQRLTNLAEELRKQLAALTARVGRVDDAAGERVMRLSRAMIFVKDLDRMADFYSHSLGLAIASDEAAHGKLG